MMANLNQNHLLEEFECKKPCQYMEYQFSGEPLNLHDQSSTKLQIMFDSHSVIVKKEVEAYSFGTLVADCGGVLGLFIGFNFLMIWDLMSMLVFKSKKNVLIPGGSTNLP